MTIENYVDKGLLYLEGFGGFGYKRIMKSFQRGALKSITYILKEEGASVEINRTYLPFVVWGIDRQVLSASKGDETCRVVLERFFGFDNFFCGYPLELKIDSFDSSSKLHQAVAGKLSEIEDFFRYEFDRGHRLKRDGGYTLPFPHAVDIANRGNF